MLHFEWTMKALAAGKHVLNEKPSADTADEARQMFELAEKKGLVLLDAYHYRQVLCLIYVGCQLTRYGRFHPAIQRFKEIIDSGEIGRLKHIQVDMLMFQAALGDDDIRYDYNLGGGALMDLGCK